MMLKRGILFSLSSCGRGEGRPAGRQVDGRPGTGRVQPRGMGTPGRDNGVQRLPVTVRGPAGRGTVAGRRRAGVNA
ncbi:hypothetical protein GCM10010360_69700 [Streptomyces nogalater]